MANPLSSRGWSDRDYAAAVGTLMGEAAVRGSLQDYQAIADVVANRLSSGQFGKNIAGITMNPSQFSTWSPKEKNAYQSAVMGYAAALDPNVVGKMPASAQERFSLAQQAVNDVFNTGVARGIAQGATFYDNPAVTAKLGTAGFHNQLEDKYGSIMIGAHRFSGPGLTDVPFDPVTYNGMLDVPPAAEPFLGDVLINQPSINPVPSGIVQANALPDIAPAPEAGFSWDLSGATLPDNLDIGFDVPEATPDFSSITAGTAFDPLSSITPAAPASPSFTDVSGPTYPDITESLYSAPDFNAQAADWGSMPETYGPSMSEMGAAPDFHAGVDAGPYGSVPDVSAPSLEARNNFDRQMGAVDAFNGQSWNSSDLNQDAIAASLNKELSPQASAPQLSTPSFDMQSAYLGDMADKFGAPQLSTPSVSPQAPQAPATAARSSPPSQGDWGGFTHGLEGFDTNALGNAYGSFMDNFGKSAIAAAPGAPAVNQKADGPFSSITGPINDAVKSVTDPINSAISSFTDPVKQGMRDLGLTGNFGAGGMQVPNGMGGYRDADFMDAMSNPTLAEAYHSGLFGGWTGGALKGAAMGALTGGLPGALVGGLWGGLNPFGAIQNSLESAFGIDPYAGLSDMDLAAFARGREYGTREPTGRNESGSASIGDGSYAEGSGRNDNDPQGIL